MKIFVYALCDPEGGEVRYVGQSINLTNRLHTHFNGKGCIAVRDWLRSLRVKGQRPTIKLLAETEHASEAWTLETAWIEHYKPTGLLLNVSRGRLKVPTHCNSRPGRPKSSVLVRVNFALHPDDLKQLEKIKRRERIESDVGALRYALAKAAG